MEISLDLIMLLTNGVFTLLCGFVIVYLLLLKRLVPSLFYYSWITGFFIYGIEIILRVLGVIPQILVEAMVFGAFVCFATGVLYLSRAKILLAILAVISCFSFVFVFIYLSGIISSSILAAFGGSVVYLFVAAAIVHQRFIFGISTERLAIGWLLLYYTNIFLPNMGWITDIFAILAKILILMGIVNYDFIVIAKKAREKHFPPPEAGYGREGGFKLLFSSENQNAMLRESNWLRKRIEINVKQGLETSIFAFQDVVPHNELRSLKWISPEKVFIYLFSSSAQKAKSEFTVLPMGLAQIGAALSQVMKQNKSSENGCVVVFFHLSLLIQLYGTDAVYEMLLNKMGYLRENGITLYLVFYPSIHNEQSTISLFTQLADETIKL